MVLRSSRQPKHVPAIALATVCFILSPVTFSLAQQNTSASIPDTVRRPIEEVLKAYEATYNNHDLAGLLKVWPALPSQKQYKEVKWHLSGDPNIFGEKMQVTIQAWQWSSGKATLQCEAEDRYSRIESRSEILIGDLNMNSPAMNPARTMKKKVVDQKTQEDIQMLKTPDGWKILSIDAHKQHK